MHPERDSAFSDMGITTETRDIEFPSKTSIFKNYLENRLPWQTLTSQKLIENNVFVTSRGYGVVRNEKLYRIPISNRKSAGRIPSHVRFYGTKRIDAV